MERGRTSREDEGQGGDDTSGVASLTAELESSLKATLNKYAESRVEAYKLGVLAGEDIWDQFTNDFYG
jgi:hypothetical protein